MPLNPLEPPLCRRDIATTADPSQSWGWIRHEMRRMLCYDDPGMP